MLCRLLLTAAAISYLLCMLLLSGVQKEDLDVNMLRKLQQYNVNIDNMNNEILRQNCQTTTLYSTKNSNERYTKETFYTTTVEYTTETLAKKNLELLLKYFVKKTDEDKERPEVNIKDVEYVTNVPIKQRKNNINVKYIEKDYEITTTDANSNRDNVVENPNLEKVLKFWQMFSKTTTQPTFEYTTKNIRINMNNYKNTDTKSKESEYINKIIEEFISKSQTFAPTIQTTTERKFDIDRIYREIGRLLNKKPHEEHTLRNVAPKNIEELNMGRYNKLKDVDMFLNYKQDTKRSDISTEIQKSKLKNIVLRDFEEVLNKNDQNNDYPFGLYNENTPNNRVTRITNEDTFTKNIDTKQVNVITPEVIKNIAESVKALVIKDLRKDIPTTTKATTTVTTTTMPPPRTEITSTAKPDRTTKIPDATQVIKSFMELFQQFKNMNDKTIVTDAKVKITEKKDTKHEFNIPVMYPPQMPAVNPYGIKTNIQKSSNVQPYNQPPYLNAPIQNQPNFPIQNQNIAKTMTSQNRVINIQNFPVTPLTIQTNLDEIPPLAIPLSKPAKLINQVIVVTTNRPVFRGKIEHHWGSNRNSKYSSFLDDKKNSGSRPRNFGSLENHRDYGSHYSQRHGYLDENPRIKDDLKYKTDRYEPNNHRYENYRTKYDKFDDEHSRHHNYSPQRFHEKLERVDNWEDSAENKGNINNDECSKMKVASRQLLPLTGIKKGSHYDDTHFKNFLKTQQKVNDMLEKILSTKTKMDEIRSVETT